MKLRNRDHRIALRDIADHAHRAELIEGGGKGQVPCLLVCSPDQSQLWVYESDDIIKYMEQHQLLA